MLDTVGVNERLSDTLQEIEGDGWEIFGIYRIYHPHADGHWEILCRKGGEGEEDDG
jgi:hypothetical protein